jgi:hypothetical protein
MRLNRGTALLGLLVLVLPGCGDDECQRLTTCDIRDAGCQRAVMGWLSCLKPSTGELPEVESVSEDEFVERVRSLQDDEIESSDLARAAEWNRGLSLFGLAPEQYDREDQLRAQSAQVAAAYIPKHKRVLVIDRGKPMDDIDAVAILAHEFVHALQDSELNLERYGEHWGKTYDSSLALTGLIEGEAVHYQLLASLDHRGLTVDRIDWKAFYADWRESELKDAAEDTAPVQNAGLRFPYAFGGGFVTQNWLVGGRRQIEALFEKPPRATREILFGPAAEDLAPILSEVRAHGLPALGPSFEPQGKATLGAWVTNIYARRVALQEPERWELSRALAGDVFTVQHNADTGQTIAAWHLAAVPESDLKLWGPGTLTFVSAWSPNQAREVYLVGSQPGVPPRPQDLEWGDEEMSEMQPEAAGEEGVSRVRARVCASRFPHQLLLEHVRR